MTTCPDRSRPPASSARGAVAAWLLLGGVTLGLLGLQAVPRAGLPVLLVFPPGLHPDRALAGVLAVPGWDPALVRDLGPLVIAVAAPADGLADAAALRRGSGAWLTLSAPGRAACAAWSG
jgi:hypothetical protein